MKTFSTIAVAALATLATATPIQQQRRQHFGVEVTLTRVNLQTNNNTQFTITPGTMYYDGGLTEATGLELTSVDNLFGGLTIGLGNITCRGYDDDFGAVSNTASFGGFAGAASQIGDGTPTPVEYVLCLINDGEGDCAL